MFALAYTSLISAADLTAMQADVNVSASGILIAVVAICAVGLLIRVFSR